MAATALTPWAPYRSDFAGHKPLRRQDLVGRRVAVVGLGVAGLGMARLLHQLGARLVLVDARAALAATLAAAFPDAELHLGVHLGHGPGASAAEALCGCAFAALAPGVDPRQPAIVQALEAGAYAFGEVELIGLRRRPATTLAITGTNGKSTTTALCGALFAACGVATFVGGNLGPALSGWAGDEAGPDRAVLELSSYQIDGARTYRPDVAAVLNLAPDHLARYGDMVHYAHSKARLLTLLGSRGIAVLNADDPAVRAMAPLAAGERLWFGRGAILPGPGLRARGDTLELIGEQDTAVDLRACAGSWPHPVLVGGHNQQNTMAALLATCALLHRAGAQVEAAGPVLRQGHRSFAGLPHRLAPVATVGEVLWVDDSKATNDASAATAVLAMARPMVLLVGGLDDPNEPMAQLLQALTQRPPRAVVTFGAAAPRLQRLMAETAWAARSKLVADPKLEGACQLAQGLAQPGDVVLLAPGCKSFDAFTDYQHRGRAFAAWVHAAGARA